MAKCYFSPDTMMFLRKLAQNNDRVWFEQNKMEYEAHVRAPALAFINDCADELALLSPHFLAQAKKVGGSLMRVHRDIRFARDKTPYKTNIGIQFRHERGKDVHAPGFYVHISPMECFLGVGIWHPESHSLARVRDALVEQEDKWRAAIQVKTFARQFSLGGESLQQAPRGYAKDHPLLNDLKRKDFIAICRLTEAQVLGPRFRELVMRRFASADSFMHFLCSALNLQY